MPDESLTNQQLKELVRRVVITQGNAFIKDLLRDNHSRIGSTKDEFISNLEDAIDEGNLTQAKLDAWLEAVEGWGDQHVYVLVSPTTTPTLVARAISASPIARYCDAAPSLHFPDMLELTQVRSTSDGLSIVWHQRKEGWNRWSARDRRETEGLDQLWYQAYRQRLDRSVVRFEWRYLDPYCAILIQRSPQIDHTSVFSTIESLLTQLGITDAPFSRVGLTHAIHVSSLLANGAQSTRFELDDGYVEVAVNTPGSGIDSVEPVRLVLQSVDASQFDRAQGMLNFAAEEHGTSRSLSVEVFGEQARLRIWAQCKRDDVLRILRVVWECNQQR